MTVMHFFGCTFIAFGPPFALFWITIANDPVKIIILIASAFFWLISLLFSSLIWKLLSLGMDDPTLSIIISVLLQELSRYVIYLLLRKAEAGLEKVSDSGTKLVENKHILAYVAGLGFGIMSSSFALINILAEALGPGTMGLKNGHQGQFFFLTSSLIGLCFIFLHLAWGVIYFHALDNKNYILIAYVILTHLAASLLTLFNYIPLYFASIIPNYFLLILSLWLAFRVAGGELRMSLLLSRRPTRNNSQSSPQEPISVPA